MVDKEEKILTAEEYTKYATKKGQTAYNLLADLVSSKAYQQMSDEERVDVVKIAYDYANQIAKAAVSKFEPEEWVKNTKYIKTTCGISQGTFLVLKTLAGEIEEGLKDAKKVDENGKPVTIQNSKSLLIMNKIYDTKMVISLTQEQRETLFAYLGVGKSVRHYNQARVKEKLAQMRKKAG